MPLNIAVCVKRAPDTAADKNLDPTDFTLVRNPDESILNPVDEVAVEEALRLKEAHGGEVTVVTMGPEAALTKAARRALSMGCDRAVHLSDPVLHGSDAEAIAYALTCADVGIEASRVGLAGSRSEVLGFGARSTERRRILIDNKDGNAHIKLADFLQEAKLI